LQLFLNQRRYDQILRQAWLNGTVPSMVARKLEGEINPGGWESL
jgi:E3 ubiquitin-protein ligase UBR1